MLVPAFHEFGLIEVTTGVGSPTLNGAALLVPKRVNIQIVRIPFRIRRQVAFTSSR
jgi:hypothetical protein